MKARVVLPLLMAFLLGIIFGLPHLLIPRILGSSRPYTPFAISGVSALTYDETSVYAAQVHYAAIRWKPPYDTDAFEHRDVPSLVSPVPHFLIAAVARILGGVDRAFILCDFFLPPAAFLLFFALFLGMTDDPILSAAGGAACLLLPFGPRNFLQSSIEILATGHASQVQPLEYSRLVHPELSFTIFLAALLFLWRTLRQGRSRDALLAGLFGGGLFYLYLYYWFPWITLCFLLLAYSVWDPERRRPLWIIHGITWLTGSLFWVHTFRAGTFPNASWQLERFNWILGHNLSPEKLIYTFKTTAVFLCLALIFRCLVMPKSSPQAKTRQGASLLFWSSLFLSSILALNSELITGRNILAMPHYPTRLFQPVLCMALFALVGPLGSRRANACWKWSAAAGLGILLILSFLRQEAVARNTAWAHEVRQEHRLLFSWLNQKTHLDDTLITTDLEINTQIPVYTHARAFVPSGARSSASNQEIERRFLIAMKLLGHSETEVRKLLAQEASAAEPPLQLTHSFYLFLGGYGQISRRLPLKKIEGILREFRQMDLAQELGRFRANYVYRRATENLQPLPGWSFTTVYTDPYGSVAAIEKQP